MRERERDTAVSAGDGRGAALACVAAVSFLTRLPVDPRGRVGPHDVARSVPLFPFVGAAIGLVTAAAAWTFTRAVPPAVAAVGAVAAQVLLTGALHTDGLADTADGYGGATREGALEIMRDHATGAFGTVAIVVDLLLKTASIAVLSTASGGLWVVVAASALSRSAIGVAGTIAPRARGDEGAGSILAGPARAVRATGAAAAGVSLAWVVAGVRGLVAGAAVAGAAALWTWRCTRRLGGVTGDTLGATAEGTEALALLVGLAFR